MGIGFKSFKRLRLCDCVAVTWLKPGVTETDDDSIKRKRKRKIVARCRSWRSKCLVSQPQLIARDLFQSFRMGARRIEVLRGISIDVAHGEIIFICGASGAGKTTLLYTLAGLERPESGTVEFEGRNLYNGPAAAGARFRNKKMGFVFQGYFLLPELTALENLSLPGMIGGNATKNAAEE